MLSICIITKNESKNIRECLHRLSKENCEIVVVDTGSTDDTKQIALAYTDKVYDYEWCNDFAAARNFSISKASNNYILVIDSDEFLTYIDIDKVYELIKENPDAVGRISRTNVYNRGNEQCRGKERINRLFSKKMYRYEGKIHEQIVAKDAKEYQTYHAPIAVDHCGYDGDEELRMKKTLRNIMLLEEELLNKGEDPYLLYQLGKSYYMQQDYAMACEYFEKATTFDINPKLEYVIDMIHTYGYALVNTKQLDKALQFTNIYDEFGNTSDFQFLMGIIYMNNAKFDESVQEFMKATEHEDCSMEGVNSYKAYYNIGVIYECLNQREEAKKYYVKCGNYGPAIDRLNALTEHILVCEWGMCCDHLIRKNIRKMGYMVDCIATEIKDYDNDKVFIGGFTEYLSKCEKAHIMCGAVFSMDYFPVISRLCELKGIPYISWWSDSPMNTMYSKTITNQCNDIYTFDRQQYKILQKLGVKKCKHLPLGTDIDHWEQKSITQEDIDQYSADISFVGNLYNDQVTNQYQGREGFTPYVKGYLDAIVAAQRKVYGYNFVQELLTDVIITEIERTVDLNLGPLYYDSYKELLGQMVNRQISMLERIEVLNRVGSKWEVNLYTGSTTAEITAPNVHRKGYIDYEQQMPKVFALSKINLNISSKSIESGIPLRVLDIIGARGFVISNYQPELAEYFKEGVDIVMYDSMEDLEHKIQYYLDHDEERERIVEAGYKKVKEEFAFDKRMKTILSR